MNRRSLLFIVAFSGIIALYGGPQAVLARTWTSKDGRFKTEAELLDANTKEVRLRKADGKELTVPLEKLSDQDKRYIASWRRQRDKPASKRADGGTGTSTKTKQPKLAPVDITIFDDQLTMEAPAGAKVEADGPFATVRFGKRFTMAIQPHTDTDLPDFKERFIGMPDAIAVQKKLVEEEDALAYTVNVKAFNATASAYIVVVTVGDKKYTCSDVSLEDINRREKYTPADIELMIQCARTLRSKE